ncbi:TIM barrel protein [Primorskyibacter sp. S187A]|uniref:TIM barrel protein n=1 Tax=Primorskyibacter sp. S187A TaxID=3415130 RepID=UPI003C7C7292
MSKKKSFRISANIERLFQEHDLPDRIAAAADAGFSGVELPLPYDYPAPDLRDKAVFAGISFVRMDGPPPNYTGGAQGFAAAPGQQQRFQSDFKRALRQAQVLGAHRLHLRTGLEQETDANILIDNLRWAAEEAPKAILLIEALNPQDHADHCLASVGHTLDVFRSVDSDNVKLLFSTSHASRHPEGLEVLWQQAHDVTGHVLLGGGATPSEIDHYAGDMLSLLKESDYSGWACADFVPDGPTTKSLGWLGKHA